jgi:hypothetical protein
MRKAVDSLTVYLLRWQPTGGTTIRCGYSFYDGKIPAWSLNDSIVVVFEKFRKSVQGIPGWRSSSACSTRKMEKSEVTCKAASHYIPSSCL